jgi:hypothetical protein
MIDPTTRELLVRVASLEAEVMGLRRRKRRTRRLLPFTLMALLVGLLPLSVLATTPFNDLTGGVHDANIDAIYQAGVTKGCVPDVSYCPTANVTREELASFLARLGGLGSNPPIANAKTAQTAQSATSAQNATHATTADSATTAASAANAAQLNGQSASFYQAANQPVANAVNAQDAAQLGGQPPSFYQPAGQPVANATNAVSAQTANTAQVAQNANTLNGLAANQLLGVSRKELAGIALTGTDQDLFTFSIIVPSAGYVLVSATAMAYTFDTSGCPCQIDLRFYDVTHNSTGDIYVLRDTLVNAPVDGQRGFASLANQWLMRTEQAGTYVFAVRMSRPNGTASVEADAVATALFVPFYYGPPLTAPGD